MKYRYKLEGSDPSYGLQCRFKVEKSANAPIKFSINFFCTIVQHVMFLFKTPVFHVIRRNCKANLCHYAEHNDQIIGSLPLNQFNV